MKITLDEKTCLKNKLTLQEALIATAVGMGNYKSVFDNMINRHVLGIMGQSLDSKWKDTIKNLIDAEDARFETLAIKVQECFPNRR